MTPTEIPTQVFSCEYCKIFKNTCLKNICDRVLRFTVIKLLKETCFMVSMLRYYLNKSWKAMDTINTITITQKQSPKRFSIKKVFLKNYQNSQEKSCVGVSFLIKLQASGLQHRCFPGYFAKFLGTPFFTKHLRWLLLTMALLLTINTVIFNIIILTIKRS